MLPDFVTNILKDNGIAGAIVMVLLLTIIGLASVIKHLYSHNQKVYGYRLQERDLLNKALTDTAASINAMKIVAEERNEVTDELSNAFSLLAAKIELNHLSFKEELIRNSAAISSAAIIYSKTVEDIRLFLMNSQPSGHRR